MKSKLVSVIIAVSLALTAPVDVGAQNSSYALTERKKSPAGLLITKFGPTRKGDRCVNCRTRTAIF